MTVQRLRTAIITSKLLGRLGTYSLWFKKGKPSGFVRLIEPVDSQIEAGRINFAANHVEADLLDESFTADGLIVARNRAVEDIDEVAISKRISGFFTEASIVAKYLLMS